MTTEAPLKTLSFLVHLVLGFILGVAAAGGLK